MELDDREGHGGAGGWPRDRGQWGRVGRDSLAADLNLERLGVIVLQGEDVGDSHLGVVGFNDTLDRLGNHIGSGTGVGAGRDG